MGYTRAEQVLPLEIVEQIQKYVDGENIYIPKKEGNRQEWGKGTQIRKELNARNEEIYLNFIGGQSISRLAEKYYLSEKSIQRILREMK